MNQSTSPGLRLIAVAFLAALAAIAWQTSSGRLSPNIALVTVAAAVALAVASLAASAFMAGP